MNYTSESEHNITGRGKVFAVKADENLIEGDLIGKIIFIDENPYLLKGIERMGITRIGSLVGLLVRPIEE